MGGADILPDGLAHVQAVHDRHHDVADDDVRDLADGGLEPFPALGSEQDGVFGFERFPDVLEDLGIVLHDQDPDLAGGAGRLLGIFLLLDGRDLRILMNGLRIVLRRVEQETEFAPLAQLAADGQPDVVQLAEILDQRQADSGTGRLVRPLDLEVAVEEMLLVGGRDAAARVAHGDGHPVPFPLQREHDFAGRRVFLRVGKQVVEDNGNGLGVKLQPHVRLHGQHDLHRPVGSQAAELFAHLRHELRQVAVADREAPVVRLGLAEFQQLVHEAQQLLGALLHLADAAAGRDRQGLVFGEVLQRAENQGERRTQFVGDVGIEDHALLAGLPLLHQTGFLEFLAILAGQLAVEMKHHDRNEAERQQDIKALRPPGQPERRPHLQLGGSHIRAPFRVVQA